MICVDLRQHANDLPFETEAGLCSVCQNLGFEWFGECTDCPGGFHSLLSTYSEKYSKFHIGTVRQLLDKPSCPGCRLILSSLEISRPIPLALLEREVDFVPSLITRWDDDLKRGFCYGNGVASGAYFEVTLKDAQAASSRSTRIGRIVRNGPWFGEESPTKFTISKDGDEMKMTELRGRTIAPIIDIGIIKEWMRACEVHHGYCKMLPPPSSNGNSFRLIDVQEQKIISSTQPERYIALSYVWGSSTVAVLTQDTLHQYSSNYGLRAAKLPQTIVDCIQLVKGLGERYLWVDSLCIIQDDYDDKLEQLRTMDNVYRNAALVIVAAAGDDAHSGLCGIGHLQRREWQRRETVCGLPYMTAQPPLRDVLGRTIWNSRGWTFQEAILARRILFFTEEQVYWSCKCANWREDMAWETSHGISLSHPFDSYWESRAMNCRTAKYCQDVTAFTKREIKQQSDVIWAFMGILKLHSSRFPKGFIWGHPLERLDATLIWYGCFDSGHHRTAKYSLSYNGGMQSVQYPSWSWLSTDTQVTFGNPCGDGIISKVKWHEPLFFDDLTGFPSINGTLELDKQTKKLFSGSKGDVTKYGLLQCTAETVELLVVRSIYKSSQSGQSTENSEYVFNTSTGKHGFLLPSHPVPATIQFPSGETAGTLYIQNKFFVGCDQQLGQFVLLSSNAKNEADEICVEMPDGLDCGNISHGHACKHIQSYNIMLVERRGDITYRLALHTVESEVWQKVTTQKEHFILG